MQTVGAKKLNMGGKSLPFRMCPDGNAPAGVDKVDDLPGENTLFRDEGWCSLAEVLIVGFVGGIYIALSHHGLGNMGAPYRFCQAFSLYLLEVDAYSQRLEDGDHLFQPLAAGLLKIRNPFKQGMIMAVGEIADNMDILLLQGATKLNCRYEGKPSGLSLFRCFADAPYGVVVCNGDNIQLISRCPGNYLLRGIETVGYIAMDMKVYLDLFPLLCWCGYLYSSNTIFNFRLFPLRSTVMVRESPTRWL